MKSIDKTLKNAIFKRLLITFLLIMVPIYILGISIYNWAIGTLIKEISSSMNSQASFYMSNLENEIRGMQRFVYGLVIDKDLRAISVLPQLLDYFEVNNAVLNIQSKLFTMKNSSSYVKDARVHIPSIGKTISGVNGYSDMNMSEFAALDILPANSVSSVTYRNGMMNVYAAFPYVDLSDNESPMAEIVIELSSQNLVDSLSSIKNNSESRTMLVSQSDPFMISNDFDAARSEQIKNSILEELKGRKSDYRFYIFNGKRYLVVSQESKYLGMILATYISEDVLLENLETYQLWFLLFTISVVVIIVTYSLSTYRFIHKPLVKLAESFLQMEKGDLDIFIAHNRADEFRYIYQRFNVMTENLKLLIDQVYKQKILAQRAEMKQLQSQINPHFLYNSFFILSRMVASEDYDNVQKFSDYLGDYFRFITRSADDEIDLKLEVDHARTYAEIQAMRFSKQINTVRFDELPDQYYNLQVPRLIMQPLIENAFEHGLKDMERGGILIVKIFSGIGNLNIVVEDNGPCISRSEIENMGKKLDDVDDNAEKTGLVNIHRRLQLRFGKDGGISVALSELGGLKITLCIPYKKEFDNA